jgi:hypothetical protein
MKTLKTVYCLSLATILLVSCGRSSNREELSEPSRMYSEEMNDEVMLSEIAPDEGEMLVLSGNVNNVSSYYSNEITDATNANNYKRSISSSAAVNDDSDTTHKFIRTAHLRFKVKDAIASTYDIENIVAKNGGFVTHTKLSGEVNSSNKTRVSADSVLITTYYTVTNSMKLRVPSQKLDITLKEIARNIDFLDYRIIQADDVALQILANKLTQKRATKTGQRLSDAIDNQGRKLSETASAEELLSRKQQQADETMIANLSLADQIAFSTIHLYIYQPQTVKRELIANDENIKAYEPSFGSKFVDALSFGWDILKAIVLFLTQIWGLFLIAILAYVLYRIYKKYLKGGKPNN